MLLCRRVALLPPCRVELLVAYWPVVQPCGVMTAGAACAAPSVHLQGAEADSAAAGLAVLLDVLLIAHHSSCSGARPDGVQRHAGMLACWLA